jgi:dipeptidyl aminopeptidase/acylaminoacyl peptidase
MDDEAHGAVRYDHPVEPPTLSLAMKPILAVALLAPCLLFSLLAGCCLCSPLGAQEGYRKPPSAILACITAARPPAVSLSPDRSNLLLSTRESMVSIAAQARPILRLAGRRIDPGSRGPQRGRRTTGFALLGVQTGETRKVELPDDVDLGGAVWTVDGKRFAFTNTRDDGIELWVCDAATATARKVPGITLVGTTGTPASWMPDQKTLLCRLVSDAGAPPQRPRAPKGPIVQESSGRRAPVRTYQDLLRDEHDVALYEFYVTSQLALVDPDTGTIKKIGAPGIYSGASASPDGRYLLIRRQHRPFSFLVTSRSFPQEIVVWDLAGNVVRKVTDMPLAENVPIGGVLTGRRRVLWIPTEDATLYWAEALDGGNPRTQVPHRDKVMVQQAQSKAPPAEWTRTKERFAGVSFGERGDLALLSEFSRKERQTRTWKVYPRNLAKKPELLLERSAQDAYGDPGRPLMKRSPRGKGVIRQLGDAILLKGDGASPQGDRPFLDLWHLDTNKKERLFHCRAGTLESVASLLTEDASRILVRHESPTEVPNYLALDTKTGNRQALTHFTDPTARITKNIKGTLIKYQRKDGVPLSGTLYLPPDHREGQKHPALVWAYPREFKSRRDAGQVRGSPYRYTRLSGTSPLLLTLAGYAVFNGATMPIVGPTRTANDTFVKQLVASGKAAVDKLVQMGVADGDRIAIAGHSYGAFMTANLLAHSDLFRAGIARSGAYNRTLTPFGFQNERRTYWEAPDIYFKMSPFMHAPKINEPLLLIHGVMDNNSGTFPIQSRRLFHAVKGSGGTARLVMLPFESHGYRARESVLHTVAETVDWLDQHVKNAAPRPAKAVEATGIKDGAKDGN